MFGSVGPAPFLMKVTTALTTAFFITSLGLGLLFAHSGKTATSGAALLEKMKQAAPASSGPVSTPNPSLAPKVLPGTEGGKGSQ
jgi:hypothetical protein